MYSYNHTEIYKQQLTDPNFMKEEGYHEYLMKVIEIYSDLYKNSTDDDSFCSFYLKTGCCRYGDRCKKTHFTPPVSTTILIEKFYQAPNFVGRKKTTPSVAFGDSILDMDENEDFDRYTEFFSDVFPEVKKFGNIVSFKCCNNITPHLRGNVFVQFEDVKSAISAYIGLNGRFYAGNRLRVQFSQLNDWKIAICAYNGTSYCPKSVECNFLHVFENPINDKAREKASKNRSEKNNQTKEKKRSSRSRSRERDRKKDKKKDKKRSKSKEKNEKEFNYKNKNRKNKCRSRSN